MIPKISRFLCVVVISIITLCQAEASVFTARLDASPSSIYETGSTNLVLTLNYSTESYGTFHHSEGGYYSGANYYYSGSAAINSFSATLNPGDGQSSITMYGGSSSTYLQTSRLFTYMSPGSWTASVSGVAPQVQDNLFYDGWSYNGRYWNTYHGNTAIYRGIPINASTQVNVNNINPSIQSIEWNPSVQVGEGLTFSVAGSDPGGVGSTELMTFAYDFDGDGLYDDYIQSGNSLNSSGSYIFNTPGSRSVGVKLSDGLGGVSYASFGVTVNSPVPEPATIIIWSLLGGLGLVFAWRRRKIA